MMGAGDPTQPKNKQLGRSVKVGSFYMSKTEITVEQYTHCVHAGVCDSFGLDEYKYCNWGRSSRAQHPMNCVTWKQAQTFAKWAGGELPHEIQWEFAARAGQSQHKYAGSNDLNDVGWYKNNTVSQETQEVAQKKANAYGFYDFSGNVWEWTKGVHTSKSKSWIIRGGGWESDESDAHILFRTKIKPETRRYDVGFRIVRSAQKINDGKKPKKSKRRKEIRGKRRSRMIWKL